jgi:hypothetical protein
MTKRNGFGFANGTVQHLTIGLHCYAASQRRRARWTIVTVALAFSLFVVSQCQFAAGAAPQGQTNKETTANAIALSRENTDVTNSAAFPAARRVRVDESFKLDCEKAGLVTLSGTPSSAVCPDDQGHLIAVSVTTTGTLRDDQRQIDLVSNGVALTITDSHGSVRITAKDIDLKHWGIFAWVVTLVCFLLSAQTALSFLKHNSRLFTAMALFALGWAILLIYYGNIGDRTHLRDLTAFVDFLWIYMAALLRLVAMEADLVPRGSTMRETVIPLQGFALLLLGVLVAPSEPFTDFAKANVVSLGISMALDIAAAICVILAMRRLCGKMHFWWSAVILIPYGLLDLQSEIRDIMNQGRTLDDWEYVALSVAKIIFSVYFCVAIAYRTMRPEERQQGLLYWLERLLCISGPLPGSARPLGANVSK